MHPERRFYERQRLVTSLRKANGYRVYGNDAIKALCFIVRAKELGFTLDEIREVLQIRGASREPCGCVKDIIEIERNLRPIERRMEALGELRREFEQLAAPSALPPSSSPICPIIETRA